MRLTCLKSAAYVFRMTLTNLNPAGGRAFLATSAGSDVIDFGPDHGADWPLWSIRSLTDGNDLGLSTGLCDRLRGWADQYASHMSDDYEWEPDFDHIHFDEVGDRLAAEVATELGSNYSVRRTTGDTYPWWRSTEPPTNTYAAAVLASWIAAHDRETEERQSLRAAGVVIAADIGTAFLPTKAETEP